MLSAVQRPSISNTPTDSDDDTVRVGPSFCQKDTSIITVPGNIGIASDEQSPQIHDTDYGNNNTSTSDNNNNNVNHISLGGMVGGVPVHDSEHKGYNDMEYNVDDTPAHPSATGPTPSSPSSTSRPFKLNNQYHSNSNSNSSNSSNHLMQGSPSIPSILSFQPHQDHQLVKLKSEHEFPPLSPSTLPLQSTTVFGQHMSTPGISVTPHGDDNIDEANHLTEEIHSQALPGSSTPHNEPIEEGSNHDQSHDQYHHQLRPRCQSSSCQKQSHLILEASPNVTSAPSSQPAASSMTVLVPVTSSLPSGSGTTAVMSSRRSSLRTMPPTLPRSALQEETIALFKQYRNLIKCVKCSSRNTIQRDGMSDGNLRFKCRPPVSMNLTCNKSYSESKIRNMIASVVYGPTLPEPCTSVSMAPINQSSENTLALAPPNTNARGSRRPSHQRSEGFNASIVESAEAQAEVERFQEHNTQARQYGTEEFIVSGHCQPSYEEMNINGGHPHPVDDRRPSQGCLLQGAGVTSRGVSSPQPQSNHRLAVGEGPAMMDYEDSIILPSPNHLQVPRTPPLESDDSRLYQRPYATFGRRSVTPTSQSSLGAATRPFPKLHHSHSHPNIGQHQYQQYLEQQERERRNNGVLSNGRSHRYPSHNQQNYAHYQQQQQQRPGMRHNMRRGSAPYQYHYHQREAMAIIESRLSRPAVPQPPSTSSRFLSVGPSDGAHSPAMSSSSRSSPGHEPSSSLHQALGQSNPLAYSQRRMSQPHSSSDSSKRIYSQAPPAILEFSDPLYDHGRRISGPEEFSREQCEKYEKLNVDAMISQHHSSTNANFLPYSLNIPYCQQQEQQERHQRQGRGLSYGQSSPALSALRAVQSDPMISDSYNHVRQQSSSLSSIYHQVPSQNGMNPQSSCHPTADEIEDRIYARMRQRSFKRPNMAGPLGRSVTDTNLYNNAIKDLNDALPRSTIKLTCFPNAAANDENKEGDMEMATSATTASAEVARRPVILDSTDAVAMKLSQSSKVVIEITQPRHRAFESSRSRSSSLAAAFGSAPAPFYPQQQYGGGKLLRHAISQPNMLIHSTSSILGQRRSASPDEEGMVLGSSKKHCAGSLSGPKEEERGSGDINKSNDDDASAIFTGRATSIVAGNPTQKQRGIPTLSTTASAFIRPQTTGLNSTHKDGHAAGYKDKIGLDVRVALYGSNSETDVEPKYTASANEGKSTVGSPMIEALGVAKASSCMKFEHQKELGIDYSFFTRVETAGWRILIPPNVVASFRSEDFGLTLKPKVVDAGVGLGKNGSSVVANDTDPIAISGGSVPTTAAIQKMEMGCSFESAPLVYEEVDDVGMMEINGKNQIEDEATQSIKNDDDMVEAGSHVQGTTATNLAAAVEEIGEEGMREEEMATMVESPIVQPQITSEDDQEMDELED